MSEIYDEHIRESLLSAKVKVPADAWEGIAGRIGSSYAQSRRSKDRRWYCYGAALCGAVAALAVFVFHRADRDGFTQRQDIFNIVASADNSIECAGLAFADGVRPLDGGLVRREILAEVAPEISGGTGMSEETESVSSIFNQETIDNESKWEDPFASMMAEDNRAARNIKEKPSFKLRGSIGVNDAHSNTAFRGAQWTSGYSPEGMEEQSVSTFSIPVTVGLSFSFPINSHFSYSVGLDWTLMTRYFQGAYNTMEGEVAHYVHYIGVPVNLYYTFNPWNNFRIYSFAGASLEKCVNSKYYIFSETTSPVYSDKDAAFQLGLKAGFGISFQISNVAALFFDPYVGYYVSSSQPKSLRTEHPLMMSFDFGLRLNL